MEIKQCTYQEVYIENKYQGLGHYLEQGGNRQNRGGGGHREFKSRRGRCWHPAKKTQKQPVAPLWFPRV